jgi:DNA-directed RNA polymerase specialized sigma24 family protein
MTAIALILSEDHDAPDEEPPEELDLVCIATNRERAPYEYAPCGRRPPHRPLATATPPGSRRTGHRPEHGHGAPETPDERDRLVQPLATLRCCRRRTVVLRPLAGMTEREITDELDASFGTVNATAPCGLDQLRSVLSASNEADARGRLSSLLQPVDDDGSPS